MKVSRREFAGGCAAVMATASYLGSLASAWPQEAEATKASFSFDALGAEAKKLSEGDFNSTWGQIPRALGNLT